MSETRNGLPFLYNNAKYPLQFAQYMSASTHTFLSQYICIYIEINESVGVCVGEYVCVYVGVCVGVLLNAIESWVHCCRVVDSVADVYRANRV